MVCVRVCACVCVCMRFRCTLALSKLRAIVIKYPHIIALGLESVSLGLTLKGESTVSQSLQKPALRCV